MRHLRRTRVLARRGNRALIYFAPIWAVVMLIVLVCSLATAAILTGYLVAGATGVGALVLAWLGLSLRVIRLQPSGRPRRGPSPPDGTGVREPRHPLPNAPAGAAAMPIPDEQPSQFP